MRQWYVQPRAITQPAAVHIPYLVFTCFSCNADISDKVLGCGTLRSSPDYGRFASSRSGYLLAPVQEALLECYGGIHLASALDRHFKRFHPVPPAVHAGLSPASPERSDKRAPPRDNPPRCPRACPSRTGRACMPPELFGELLGQSTGDKAAKDIPNHQGRGHGHSASGARRCVQDAHVSFGEPGRCLVGQAEVTGVVQHQTKVLTEQNADTNADWPAATDLAWDMAPRHG